MWECQYYHIKIGIWRKPKNIQEGKLQMNFEDRLKNEIGRDTGFILPEGSLEKVYAEVSSKLPERAKRKPDVITKWQRIKPYIYMAAMFAGIWCMMKVFHTVSSPEVSLENPPEFVAEAIMELPSTETYGTESDLKDFELEAEVSESYTDIGDFEKDFGYELKPEYANVRIPDNI